MIARIKPFRKAAVTEAFSPGRIWASGNIERPPRETRRRGKSSSIWL